MDRLEAMALFRAAAEGGSLSAAGRALNVPLPTVSRNISELEAHLKTRLFNRSTRALTLTEAGRAYLESAKLILEQVAEAERSAAGEYIAPKGDLTISAPLGFGRLHLTPVVSEFLAVYPEIDVRLVLTDRVVHLLEDHVDCALRIGELPDSSLVALKLGAIRRVVCGSPAYFARRGRPGTPADLADHDTVAFEGLTASTQWRFRSNHGEVIVPIRPRLSVTSADAAVEAASAGVGLTNILCYQAAKAIESGALDVVLGDYEPAPAPVNLVHAGQGLLPLKLRAFLDFAAPRLRERMNKGQVLAGLPERERAEAH
jgi:DNA-binding transcriptional LysR family regulator